MKAMQDLYHPLKMRVPKQEVYVPNTRITIPNIETLHTPWLVSLDPEGSTVASGSHGTSQKCIEGSLSLAEAGDPT